jgi:hypothetical protein
MATPATTYAIVLPDGRPRCTDVTVSEVEAICDKLGYDRDQVLRQLHRKNRVTLCDDVGEFSIVRHQ